MKKYLTWTEKSEIIREAYAVKLNIKATARKYDLRPEQIRRWKRVHEKTFDSAAMPEARKRIAKSFKVLHTKSRRKDSQHYEELRLYYDNLRKSGHVSASMLIREWRRLNPSLKDVSIDTLRNRIYRWMKSQNILPSRQTLSKTPNESQIDAMVDFVASVNEAISLLPRGSVVNIDETHIEFDLVSEVDLGDGTTKKVLQMETGFISKVTVLLGVTLGGCKLPPFVIFKGKPQGRICREWTGPGSLYPKDVVYAVQSKAWMDVPAFSKWISKVWTPFTSGKKSSFLLMDESSTHMNPSCLEALSSAGTDVKIIPEEFGGRLQVVNGGMSEDFRDMVRGKYEAFKLENRGKHTRVDVAQWVSEAWERISEESIVRTWDSSGFDASLPLLEVKLVET